MSSKKHKLKAHVLELLKSRVSRTIQITSTEGETFVAAVQLGDEEEGYVIHELLSTDRPERCEKMGMSIPGWYLTPLEYIAHVCNYYEDIRPG
jgi:hypothetical protein